MRATLPDKSKPPGRSRRRACDSCSRKKIQCDAKSPQCNWCEHHNLACTYNRIWGCTVPGKPVTLPEPSGEDRGVQSTLQSRAGPGNVILNNLAYFRGHYVFSEQGQRWIEAQVGERNVFDKLLSLELPWPQLPDSSAPLPELPHRSNVEMLIVVYTSSPESLVFPVVSRSIFKDTLDLAYSPAQPAGSASAKACIYAFLSLSFLTAVIQQMTLDGLQSLIMLVQLQYFVGDLQSAATTLSIATRFLYTLGAHVPPTSPLAYDKCNRECHLRDLFWLCYSFDKDICLRTGQPPCINDTHCDLTLPPDYVRLRDSNLQPNTPQRYEHTTPLFPWDLCLSMLKSQVHQDLYTAHSLKKSAPELLSSIRNLDEKLEQWRVSLPAAFRPTLYFFPATPVSADLNTITVMLRLAYYYCVTVIHQASSRCDRAGPIPAGIASSTRLSIAASRSTLWYLERVLPLVHGECFRIVLFYAITAVLTLFCNIISDLHDPDTADNINLLQNVPRLIRSIPVRNRTLGEVIHLQYLDGLTTELGSICVRAISRSQGNAP
ncbi:C6 zinc finger domain protein [Aspergillus pseudodeflectus]|uniref:C6 zinc finger domain protein n=1 Tax=Aspergillus pseudodeflectus TaxID=176178 RepID=A0ABR4JAY7_9EURO